MIGTALDACLFQLGGPRLGSILQTLSPPILKFVTDCGENVAEPAAESCWLLGRDRYPNVRANHPVCRDNPRYCDISLHYD
jgi:hypothetical protein